MYIISINISDLTEIIEKQKLAEISMTAFKTKSLNVKLNAVI